MVLGVMSAQPGEERRGFECEIDEARSGDRDRAGVVEPGGQRGNEFLGRGPRIEFPGFGMAEHPVRLIIAVARIGRAHVRSEFGGIDESSCARGRHQGGIEFGGEVE